MTQEKTNIAELLKDCPTCMELDCIMFEKPVKYMGQSMSETYMITIRTSYDKNFYLTKEGFLYDMPDSKCIIFPKGKTTWEGFVPPVEFKAGDVLYTVTGEGEYRLCIVDCIIGDTLYTKASCSCNGHFLCTCEEQFNIEELVVMRFATKEEKQILFDAIKDNGYKWNAETKTLEKLVEPRFKVGDKIRHKTTNKTFIITGKDKLSYYVNSNHFAIWIQDQDHWELVPNKFDVNTLKPFDKVLVRDSDGGRWDITFYELYDEKNHSYHHRTLGGNLYKQCIPYEGNENLMGLVKDCDAYYKTWTNE